MNDQQTSTNINTFELEAVHDYYEELTDEKMRIAVDWRLVGMRYKDIANGIGLTHQTVRKWFMRGGVCYNAYYQELRYLDEDRKKRLKSFQYKLDEAALDAIMVLHKIIKDKTVGDRTKGELAVNILKASGRVPGKALDSDDSKIDKASAGLIIIPDNRRNETKVVQSKA